MNELLLSLRDKGNTVLVVEHKPEAIAIADHASTWVRAPARPGGEVVFEGSVAGLRRSGDDHRTAPGRPGRAEERRCGEPAGVLEVRGADTHNLRDVDVDIPLGVLVVRDRRGGLGQELADQRARSPVATAWWSSTRARSAGPGAATPRPTPGCSSRSARRSPRPTGSSPPCSARTPRARARPATAPASIYTDLGDHGRRRRAVRGVRGHAGFDASVLDYTFGGKDISEVLAMSVAEAAAFFAAGDAAVPAAHRLLGRLGDVGLDYLTLGQPLTTLSGGERQRLKLATALGEQRRRVRAGRADHRPAPGRRARLLGLLDRLVDAGRSVIVIEHHQAVMAHADWIIDLGPGAGHEGGRVVFEGTPAALVAAAESTLTGQHLAEYVR